MNGDFEKAKVFPSFVSVGYVPHLIIVMRDKITAAQLKAFFEVQRMIEKRFQDTLKRAAEGDPISRQLLGYSSDHSARKPRATKSSPAPSAALCSRMCTKGRRT